MITLGYPDSPDFKNFYPTNVLETGWEIITRWVSRMVMFGIYLTGDVPFRNVYLHGIVRALDGRKMSKSLGNVINPDDYQKDFGTDSLRMGLIGGTANGKDFSFPHDKIVGYRNFLTKIWNMARFLLGRKEHDGLTINHEVETLALAQEDKDILAKLKEAIKTVNESLEKYRFADAGETIYQFMWHDIADTYIEQTKNREDKEVALSVLAHVYTQGLKLLHPFMPFVTEKIYQTLRQEQIVSENDSQVLMVAPWPKTE